MKKILLFAILALFMCSCEEKEPEISYGYIDVYNESYCPMIFVDVITSTGDIYCQAGFDYIESFKVPVGDYTIAASFLGYDKKKTCTVYPLETVKVYFY